MQTCRRWFAPRRGKETFDRGVQVSDGQLGDNNLISLERFTLAAILAGAMSTPAFAQYELTINATPTGSGTCDSTSVTQTVTGTATLNLPLSTPNTIGILVLNGVPQAPTFGSQAGPFPFTANIGAVIEPIPSTTPPYSFSFTGLPYANGSAQGTVFALAENAGSMAPQSLPSNLHFLRCRRYPHCLRQDLRS